MATIAEKGGGEGEAVVHPQPRGGTQQQNDQEIVIMEDEEGMIILKP